MKGGKMEEKEEGGGKGRRKDEGEGEGRVGKEDKEEEHIEERGGTVTGRGTRRTRVRKQLGPLDF